VEEEKEERKKERERERERERYIAVFPDKCRCGAFPFDRPKVERT
jgi:hypothetical protein